MKTLTFLFIAVLTSVPIMVQAYTDDGSVQVTQVVNTSVGGGPIIGQSFTNTGTAGTNAEGQQEASEEESLALVQQLQKQLLSLLSQLSVTLSSTWSSLFGLSPNTLLLNGTQAKVQYAGDTTFGTRTSNGEVCPLIHTTALQEGDWGKEVSKMQTFLHTFNYLDNHVTGYFDTVTLAAVNAFQTQYRAEILAPWGLTAPTGRWYQTSIRMANVLDDCNPGCVIIDNKNTLGCE